MTIEGSTEINRDRYNEMRELLEREKPDVVITHWPIECRYAPLFARPCLPVHCMGGVATKSPQNVPAPPIKKHSGHGVERSTATVYHFRASDRPSCEAAAIFASISSGVL